MSTCVVKSQKFAENLKTVYSCYGKHFACMLANSWEPSSGLDEPNTYLDKGV